MNSFQDSAEPQDRQSMIQKDSKIFDESMIRMLPDNEGGLEETQNPQEIDKPQTQLLEVNDELIDLGRIQNIIRSDPHILITGPFDLEETAEITAQPSQSSTPNSPTETMPPCTGCLIADLPNTTLFELSCAHVWCQHCLRDMALTGLQNFELFPPCCCDDALSIEAVEAVLGDKKGKEYRLRLAEFETPEGEQRYCFDVRCSTFLERGGSGALELACPKCEKRMCYSCGDQAYGTTCSALSEQQRRQAEAAELEKGEAGEGAKRCPNPDCAQLLTFAGGAII